MLQSTMNKMYIDLVQDALYLQQGQLQSSLSVPETNGQHFNFEPLIWTTVALAINKFFEGVISGLGGKVADFLTDIFRNKPLKKPIEISVIVKLLKEDLDKILEMDPDKRQIEKHIDDGLELMKAYLIESGIPSYKAKNLIALWREDLANMILRKQS